MAESEAGGWTGRALPQANACKACAQYEPWHQFLVAKGWSARTKGYAPLHHVHVAESAGRNTYVRAFVHAFVNAPAGSEKRCLLVTYILVQNTGTHYREHEGTTHRDGTDPFLRRGFARRGCTATRRAVGLQTHGALRARLHDSASAPTIHGRTSSYGMWSVFWLSAKLRSSGSATVAELRTTRRRINVSASECQPGQTIA